MTPPRWSRFSIVVASLVALAGCQIIIGPPGEAEESFDLSTPFEDVGSVRVDWVNGNITVRVNPDATEITATGRKSTTAGTDDLAEEALEDFEIHLLVAESSPTQVFLQFDAPTFVAGAVYTADVELTVPEGVFLTIDSANGDVTVIGNTSITDIELANGNVEVVAQREDAFVEVDNGSVDVDSEVGNVEVVVRNGNVIIAAHPRSEGAVIAEVEIGSIEIAVPTDTSAELSLRGTIGSVSADLDGFDDVDDFTGTSVSIVATLNGGNGEIVGHTNIGSVQFDGL